MLPNARDGWQKELMALPFTHGFVRNTSNIINKSKFFDPYPNNEHLISRVKKALQLELKQHFMKLFLAFYLINQFGTYLFYFLLITIVTRPQSI